MDFADGMSFDGDGLPPQQDWGDLIDSALPQDVWDRFGDDFFSPAADPLKSDLLPSSMPEYDTSDSSPREENPEEQYNSSGDYDEDYGTGDDLNQAPSYGYGDDLDPQQSAFAFEHDEAEDPAEAFNAQDNSHLDPSLVQTDASNGLPPGYSFWRNPCTHKIEPVSNAFLASHGLLADMSTQEQTAARLGFEIAEEEREEKEPEEEEEDFESQQDTADFASFAEDSGSHSAAVQAPHGMSTSTNSSAVSGLRYTGHIHVTSSHLEETEWLPSSEQAEVQHRRRHPSRYEQFLADHASPRPGRRMNGQSAPSASFPQRSNFGYADAAFEFQQDAQMASNSHTDNSGFDGYVPDPQYYAQTPSSAFEFPQPTNFVQSGTPFATPPSAANLSFGTPISPQDSFMSDASSMPSTSRAQKRKASVQSPMPAKKFKRTVAYGGRDSAIAHLKWADRARKDNEKAHKPHSFANLAEAKEYLARAADTAIYHKLGLEKDDHQLFTDDDVEVYSQKLFSLLADWPGELTSEQTNQQGIKLQHLNKKHLDRINLVKDSLQNAEARKHVSANVEFFIDTVRQLHTKGIPMSDLHLAGFKDQDIANDTLDPAKVKTKISRYPVDHDSSFLNRLDQILDIVQINKWVAYDIITGENFLLLAASPMPYSMKKFTNNAGNGGKGRIMAAGREAIKEKEAAQ